MTAARTGPILALCLMALTANANTASEVFEIATRSTVVVIAYDSEGEVSALGSGVVLPGDVVATNCHVIEGAARLAVRYQRHEYQATTRHTDWDRDTCSVTADGLTAPAAKLGSTTGLRVGTRVYAVGAPRGLELTLSEGIVSSLRAVEGGQYIQTTAPISPGSSGGGLFDEEGRLLGLTTFYVADGQNLNFAVPVEWVGELPERHTDMAKVETAFVVWLNRTMALQESGNWRELLHHAQRWTEEQPENAHAWLWLGIAFHHLGQGTQAIEATRKGLHIDPKNPQAWFNLGATYQALGQNNQAIEAYRQTLRVDSEHSKAWSNLGVVYGTLGQNTQAMEAFQNAVRIDPETPHAWHALGVLYGALGQNTQAMEAFRNAVRIEPENAVAWYALGVFYRMTGQSGKVTETYRRLQHLDAELADLFFNDLILP